MRFLSCASDASDQLANLRRLVSARWLVLVAMTTVILAAPAFLDIPLPLLPMLAIVTVSTAFNGVAAARLRKATAATPVELLMQLCFDIASLSALIFFSGGATNPLVSLLLPPVAIAALTLPVRCVLAVGMLAVAAYSALMLVYVPLPLADAARATRLHLIGMWLTFAVSSAMIAWFVVRMTRLIRERDAQLAAAREQAMRDERVVALGTLAAGAAHELGTPLATMAVIAGELEHDASLGPMAREDIAVLRQQIGVCKEIITGLSRRAGAERLERAETVQLDRWLDGLRQRWHSLRPQAGSRFIAEGPAPAPAIVADPTLEQAVLNLLNNAANAAGDTVELTTRWGDDNLAIEVRDHGPGFAPEILAQGGRQSFPAHAQGSGIGLVLTRSAVERLGGRLTLSNPATGGALARIDLPLKPA